MADDRHFWLPLFWVSCAVGVDDGTVGEGDGIMVLSHKLSVQTAIASGTIRLQFAMHVLTRGFWAPVWGNG